MPQDNLSPVRELCINNIVFDPHTNPPEAQAFSSLESCPRHIILCILKEETTISQLSSNQHKLKILTYTKSQSAPQSPDATSYAHPSSPTAAGSPAVPDS